jgi:WD40 repeat protein
MEVLMKKFLFLFSAVLILLTCYNTQAQLISEGDTLWYKSMWPLDVLQVQYSPDGTKLGVVLNDNNDQGIFKMFDAANGKELWSFRKATYYFAQFSYSFDGNVIYILPQSDKQISVLDVNSGIVLDTLPVNSTIDEARNYGFVYTTKNPNILLLGSWSSSVILYDIAERKIIKENQTKVNCKMYACPYSEYFIKAEGYIINQDSKVRLSLYDVNTLNSVAFLEEIDASLSEGGDIKISSNGKYAATNFGTTALKIWDLENQKLFKAYTPTIPNGTFTEGMGPQWGLAFTFDNNIIVNCGGYYTDALDNEATTITNFKNDKRALIFPNNAFTTIDIQKSDQYLACGPYYELIILKLTKDAVPVKDNKVVPKLILYPNPTTGLVSLILPSKFGNIFKIEIFDNSGSLVNIFNNDINQKGNNLTINISDITNGTYLLRVSNLSNSISYKLIVKR